MQGIFYYDKISPDMFLKSLIIRGFKTFADRIELDFLSDAGITAIVGPNGCGKSNVVDAFRFALGEGNFRELRVNALPEVIFAGTDIRKPLSLAEVSLVFDNSSNFLPINYSEVAVRRKTFRDGTSEFFINQQSVRLKDLRNLFLDTGISCDSMSIISQGKVDAVLLSRPEERRIFFEEVAGVHKYKVRRIEVEKKLIICEQNLLRITDLKVEIGEQSIALEAQAKKAREYKEIQKRLKEIEVAIFKRQVEDYLSKKESIEEKLIELRAAAQEFSNQAKEISERRHLLKEEIRKKELVVDSLKLQSDEIREKIEEAHNNIILGRERKIFEEKNKIRDMAEEEKFLLFEISRFEDSIKQLDSKKAEVLSQIQQFEKANVDDLPELRPVINMGMKLIGHVNYLTEALYGKIGIALRTQAEDKLFEMLKAETSKIEREEKEIIKKIKEKNEQIKGIKKKEAELNENLLKFESAKDIKETPELKELKKEKERLEAKIGEIRGEKEKLFEKIEKFEEVPLKQTQDNTELVKEEIQLAKITGELEQIEERVKGEYGLTREELLAQETELSNLSRAKGEADELKRRLRELEPVNLMAIDEYEKVKERFDFITTQHTDINQARANLITLIGDLDGKAKENFNLTMETISKNFKEIFSSLFDGGEVKIEINENEGIDISVCPSGRKWLNLSLLSGGERALTAIALLLSFLKTQPSPLCILDEVDAALDEGNVIRFARFLKDFSSKTQIIVITHNRRTMEAADIIYGVTMEDPGVSKVVSMKLEKVQ
ncbi:MAG: chromosome segregation protein [Candidatus Saganbacteria bacterium]|uniref:Chromosome segregation protein n=1 Tax=Candidatus Saganbacteria bacterium TaxID=2575572 RepID=A0A833NY05_UNCSA|nr:MAG: chromosome segregation protein [Candidatus Saganbacteria bacterium]